METLIKSVCLTVSEGLTAEKHAQWWMKKTSFKRMVAISPEEFQGFCCGEYRWLVVNLMAQAQTSAPRQNTESELMAQQIWTRPSKQDKEEVLHCLCVDHEQNQELNAKPALHSWHCLFVRFWSIDCFHLSQETWNILFKEVKSYPHLYWQSGFSIQHICDGSRGSISF